MTDTMNTMVSDPSQPVGGGQVTSSAAPGAAGPLGQTSITSSILIAFGVSAAGLVALRYAFQKGSKSLPPVRIDAINALNIYFSWFLVNGTLKIIAYRYHGHKLAQAYLLVA